MIIDEQTNVSFSSNVQQEIIEPGPLFDFNKISLGQPSAIQGGAYFTKILYDGKPLYIQTPKSNTRQGLLKNGKKIHCDLMFGNNDGDFIHWVEDLETTCHKRILDKSSSWFQSPLEMTDIESAFNPPLKIYKSGKFYLLRTNVKVHSITNQAMIKIYNENEIPLTMDDIQADTTIISVLEIQGIKFTTRNFQIEIELKQIMTMNTDSLFETCVIKRAPTTNSTPTLIQSQPEDKEETKMEEKEEEIKEELSKSEYLENEEIKDLGVSTKPTQTIEEVIEELKPSSSFQNDLVNTILSTIEDEEEKKENDNLEKDVKDEIKSDDNEMKQQYDTDDELKEFDPLYSLEAHEINNTPFQLKKRNEVYYEIYKEARKKAKQMKKDAILAYLDAKNIQKKYMLDDLESSDDEDELSQY